MAKHYAQPIAAPRRVLPSVIWPLASAVVAVATALGFLVH